LSPLKKKITELLKKKDFTKVTNFPFPPKKIISALISLSYDKENLISWRAIEAIGLITKELSKTNPETVRNIVGRILWMIRDESGGIGWRNPEILGEIVRNSPDLCSDIAPIIMSFHDEKMLTASVLRAMGRIGKINDETVDYAAPIISSYLRSTDPALRGYAAWALGEMEISEAASELAKLNNDGMLISFYDQGELKKKTVGELAVNASAKINKGQKKFPTSGNNNRDNNHYSNN
jgi:HEAT repeat protein